MAVTPTSAPIDNSGEGDGNLQITGADAGVGASLVNQSIGDWGYARGVFAEQRNSAIRVAGMGAFPQIGDVFSQNVTDNGVIQARFGDPTKENDGHDVSEENLYENGYMGEDRKLTEGGRTVLQDFYDGAKSILNSTNRELLEKVLGSGDISSLSSKEKRDLNKLINTINQIKNMPDDEVERIVRDSQKEEDQERAGMINTAENMIISNKVDRAMTGIKNGDFSELTRMMQEVARNPTSSFNRALMESLEGALSEYSHDGVVMGFKNGNFNMSIRNDDGTYTTLKLNRQGEPDISITTRQFNEGPADVPVTGAPKPTMQQFQDLMRRRFSLGA